MSTRKVRRLAKVTGLNVEKALVRGGEGHRVLLCLRDGSVSACDLDGGNVVVTPYRWRPDPRKL